MSREVFKSSDGVRVHEMRDGSLMIGQAARVSAADAKVLAEYYESVRTAREEVGNE